MNIDNFIKNLTPDQLESLKSALIQSQQKAEQQEENIGNDFRMKRSENNNQRKRKEQVRARENTWVDTGEKKEITTPEFIPAPRTRKAPEKVKVKCHICGKSTEVDTRFVYGEFYRCNNCTG